MCRVVRSAQSSHDGEMNGSVHHLSGSDDFFYFRHSISCFETSEADFCCLVCLDVFVFHFFNFLTPL